MSGTGYTVVERADKSLAYCCDLCPHEEGNLDAARAHKAVHVAGPELLEALRFTMNRCQLYGPADAARELARNAITKAEPTKEPPPHA